MKLGRTTKCPSCNRPMVLRATGQKRHRSCAKQWKQDRVNRWRNSHPERTTVRSHYYWIVKKKGKNENYFSMPFFSGWNPEKGGSHKAGGEWILENLGSRPKGCSLHIVDHAKGFVPGNLEWAGRTKQNREQLHKIVADLKHQIKILRKALENARRK